MAKGIAAEMVKKKKKKTIDLGPKDSFQIRPGALHEDLGVPQGQKIPVSKEKAAAKGSGKTADRARLALAMKGWKK